MRLMPKYSPALQRWLKEHAINPELRTYQVDHFLLVNDGNIGVGSGADDYLAGGARGDLLWGDRGNDTLRGEGGNDLLNGGAGNDLIYGGSGNDRLQGQGGNDRLYGGNGRDALYGGTGNDHLYGGRGNDFLCGGSGIDFLWGGKGRDTFVFRPDVEASSSQSTYMDFSLRHDYLRIDGDLLPNGISVDMFSVDADGDLILTVAGGHRMVFETLETRHIASLMENIEII